MKIISLDLALGGTGVAFPDQTSYLLRNPGKIPAGVPRLAWYRDALTNILWELKPDVVAFENYAFSQVNAAHKVGEFGGVMRLVCHDVKIPFVLVSAGTIKKFATGNGAAKKPEMVSAMTHKLGRQLKTEDEADALALEALCYHYIGEEWWPTPKANCDGLKKVEWPEIMQRRRQANGVK